MNQKIQLFFNNYPNIQYNFTKNILEINKNNFKFCLKISKKINLEILDNNPENIHFISILQNKKLDNIQELLENIIQLLDNIHNYCIVCHNSLESQSESFIACSNQTCRYKFEEIIIGNPVIEYVLKDKQICSFLIESAREAILCEKNHDIFEPFPSFFLEKNIELSRENLTKLSGKNYDSSKNFDKIIKIINSIDIDGIFNLIEQNSIKSDYQLAEIIGHEAYILIRFILLSLKISLEKLPDLFGYKDPNLHAYKIIYPLDKQEEFNKLKSNQNFSYLFHGSKWQNWYSILRNGLKNCSGTQLMTNGQAYGQGIYLSSDISISMQYGTNKNKTIIGIFEILDPKKYEKTHNIYVITNEKSLIQKYLLIITNSPKKLEIELNIIFSKIIYKEEIILSAKLTNKAVSKIMKEYKSLTNTTNPFRIDLDMNQISLWKIFIDNSKFDSETKIYQDLQKYKIPEIELEIRFPDSYPFDPPFIRIIHPRFMHMTAHVTTGGSICAELLTPKGWSPGFTIENILIQIMSFIVEGNGQLDPEKYYIPYSYSESKESFMRVAGSHGWL